MKPENKEELLQILPEINDINDQELQEQVTNIFLNHTPEYFWYIPASSSGEYHQKDVVEEGEHGLLIHTKRTFTALERLQRTFVKMNRVTEDEVDYAKAGILLHDIFKQGLPPRKGNSVKNHDRIAYNYLKQNTDLPETVLGCIDSHNGGWNVGKLPENDLELLHHLADMVGSGKHIYSSIKNSTEELEDKVIDEFPKVRK